jgi:hypothetical protein
LVPPSVLAECRAEAHKTLQNARPASRVAGAVIVAIWLGVAALCMVWAYKTFMVQT